MSDSEALRFHIKDCIEYRKKTERTAAEQRGLIRDEILTAFEKKHKASEKRLASQDKILTEILTKLTGKIDKSILDVGKSWMIAVLAAGLFALVLDKLGWVKLQ